MSLKLLFLFL